MIQHFERNPEVAVQQAEFVRLLGYPAGWTLDGRPLELAERARDWFAEHGRPWAALVQTSEVYCAEQELILGGKRFASLGLLESFRGAACESAFLAAVSAGPELEVYARQLWHEEKPDEYYFLEVYGSAVVEQLLTQLGARACAWAEQHDLAVLPHASPGYEQWDIAEQARFLQVILQSVRDDLPGEISVLESGGLQPKKSQLAVFGLTTQADISLQHLGLIPCKRCSFSPCQFRRAPYSLVQFPGAELPLTMKTTSREKFSSPEQAASIRWNINPKALARWTKDRLQLDYQPDNISRARFLFEGATCTNFGRPLQFEYHVGLGPREQGYPLLEQRCLPAAEDEGRHTMCIYQADPEAFARILVSEKPLFGEPLRNVVTWQRESLGPSCFCEGSSRDRLWGYVLETIYFAIVQREKTFTQNLNSSTGAV